MNGDVLISESHWCFSTLNSLHRDSGRAAAEAWEDHGEILLLCGWKLFVAANASALSICLVLWIFCNAILNLLPYKHLNSLAQRGCSWLRNRRTMILFALGCKYECPKHSHMTFSSVCSFPEPGDLFHYIVISNHKQINLEHLHFLIKAWNLPSEQGLGVSLNNLRKSYVLQGFSSPLTISFGWWGGA